MKCAYSSASYTRPWLKRNGQPLPVVFKSNILPLLFVTVFRFSREKVFEKENSKGLTLNVNFTYTALPLVSIPAEEELNTDEEREEIVKNMKENILAAPEEKEEGTVN